MNIRALTENHCELLSQAYRRQCPKSIELGMERVYMITEGRRYFKIVGAYREDIGVSGASVHAFVDKSNGDLYMAASWNQPAKGVRFNLERDSEKLQQVVDWSGGYLYKR